MTALNFADLDAVRPEDLARYLASTGWSEQQSAEHLSVWTTGDDDDGFELLLPRNAEFRDYRARLLDAIRTIALAEEREAKDVLTDVSSIVVDTQHYRLLPQLPTGTISLVDIVDAVRGIRDLMYAAAHSTALDVPMLVQPRPRPSAVNQFVREVRLAAPKAGSFVLSAQVPLAAEPEGRLGTDEAAPPFNRRVVLRLNQAVNAVHRAAGEAIRTDSVAPFAERAEEGVSANLCAAVTLIGKSQPFDLRFAWAGLMPTTVATARLTFDRRVLSAISSAADELPRIADEAEVELVGRVIQLDRVGQGPGRATLRGAVQRPPGYVSDMSITATLPPSLYGRAVEAHRDRRRVRLVGRLQGNELVQIRTLEILDSEH